MVTEHIAPEIRENDVSECSLQQADYSRKFHVTGSIIDRIFKGAHFVKQIEGHNIVVDSMLLLTAALLKGDTSYGGIQYWAIGSGATSWDSSPVEPLASETRLTNEIGRVAIDPSEITFLNIEGNETNIPTNILQIKHTFRSTDCNGAWREFGLFGGNATEAANSGLMIDKKHHGIITKTQDMTIERTLKLTLQFL